MPVLSAAAFPALACRITRRFARPRSSISSAVPSVEPSSTTTISIGCVDAANDATVASIHSRSL
jgi:hypothetical protein